MAIAEDLEQPCPACGERDKATCIRRGMVGDRHIADFGWECNVCGYEWGFEVFTNDVWPGAF